MSLQHAAKYLAQNGRGKDTMLVHMTPKEVGSLQALARANGGSLSVNPDTGLPEAGFLDSLLPVIVGGGLMAMGVPAPMIGLGVGGVQALRTGDIGKGISAGLGAYGGAGLGAGLLGAGSAATAAEMAGGLSGASAGELAAAQQGAAQAAQEATALERLSSMGSGIEGLGSEAGRAGFMNAVGGGTGLAKAGLAAAAPLLSDMSRVDMPQAKGSGPNPYRYRFERGEASPFPTASRTGIEQSYFPNARYVAYAGGGPVEAMSDANALGANTGFPMADIQRGAYATPYQQPISQNVVTGASDTRVDPYTGTERLAEGGTAQQNPLLASPYNQEYQEYLNASDSGSNSSTTNSSSPGQGISDTAIGLGLGMMGLAEAAPGLATGIAGAIGSGIAGSQADAIGNSISAMGNVAPGMVAISDANGNITTVSTNEAIDAVDAAMGIADAVSSADGAAAAGGVGPGGAPGGAGGDGGTGDAGSAADGGGGGGDGGGGGGDGGGEANGGLLRRKYATGGLSDLGGYSDGGRLLRGPGDGVSDSIPAIIGKRQPARLADGEFVVPARIVSELGNGSTEAGARKLYAMLDRVQKARGKTVGKGKVAKDSRADKYLPA